MQRSYRYYEFVMAAFVTILICSNLIGPAKIAQLDLPLVGAVSFGAGVLFFPISYVFGDVLTEVYGYARARRVIWAGFAGLAFAALMAAIVVALPPAPFWRHQEAYEIALDRKSTRLNSSHGYISYAVFCLKKKKKQVSNLKIST